MPVVSGNVPVEWNVFHWRDDADVVQPHVTITARRLAVDHDSSVRHSASQIPCQQNGGVSRALQALAAARKRSASMAAMQPDPAAVTACR